MGSTINYNVVSDLASMSGRTSNYAVGANINASTWANNGATNAVNNGYYGKLDGLGHTIDGLTLVTQSGNVAGFVSWINEPGTVIRNLGLININYTQGNNNRNTGGIIASCESNCNAQIINSYTTGTISGQFYTGGLVGSSSNQATIKDSFFKCHNYQHER